jgi:origin recognition complex subunit 5
LYYTVVKSAECITGRHLLETIVGAIAHAVGWKNNIRRCENLAQLAVEIGRLLDDSSHKLDFGRESDHTKDKFVLVLDGIDRQRDAPPTLLPALARMGEVVSRPSS